MRGIFSKKDRAVAGEQHYPVASVEKNGRITKGLMAAITLRGPAEEALARERNLLRTLIDTMPDMIYVKDAQSRFVVANLAIAHFMGAATSEDLLGKTDFDCYPPDLAARYYADEQEIIRSGRPLLNRQEPGLGRDGHQRWFLTNKVPLRDGPGNVIGLIGIGRDVTEHVQADEALHGYARQLEVLREAVQTLGSSLQLNEILELILQQIKRVIVYDTASVLMLRDGSAPDLVACVGYTDEQVTSQQAGELLKRSPIMGKMAHDKQPVISADVRQLDDWIWVPGAEHVRSWLGVPLIARDRMIGALMLDSSQPNAFGERELQLALALAQHAAQAIENARLFAETKRRAVYLEIMNEATALSANPMEPEAILETVCRKLAKSLGLQASASLLNEDKTAATVVADCANEGRPSQVGQTMLVADTPCLQHVLTCKAPLLAEDVPNDSRLTYFHDLLRQRGIASLLFLPLLVEGQVVGTLWLESNEPRHFSAQETSLAWSVADQTAAALGRVQLNEERRRLTTAIEQAAESVVILDGDGAILYVNPAFERITGYSRAEVSGRTLGILRSGQDDESSYQAMWATVRAGETWHGRIINKRKDGVLYTDDTTISPVRNESGAIINFVEVKRDVTRELQLEEQYRQAQKMEAVGQLTAGISHDFNNLLTAINGFAQLLQFELPVEDPRQDLVQKIADAGRRAGELVRQLLTFSRKQPIMPVVLDLNVVVADMSKLLQRIIGEQVQLETDLGPEIWPVEADQAQIEQVILNLAVNARDAMPDGGKLIIETANVMLDGEYVAAHLAAQPGEHVRLMVSDTGIGMSEEVKAHLFEPFFTTKGRGKGTGLGLATVYGIVKQSGGTIWVYSEEGVGTTFKIYLPRSAKDAERQPHAGKSEPIPSGGETVLLVEDEAGVRELARLVLQRQGYSVLEAAEPQEALSLVETHTGPIHLLLTDVVMPGMSGKALAETLTGMIPDLKVLFMSGYPDQVIAHHGVLEAGIAFLQKPFNPMALARNVRKVLDAER
jgi:PAS domain S-box-containing protein